MKPIAALLLFITLLSHTITINAYPTALVTLLSNTITQVNARPAALLATGATCTPDSAGDDFCDIFCQDHDYDYGECNGSKLLCISYLAKRNVLYK